MEPRRESPPWIFQNSQAISGGDRSSVGVVALEYVDVEVVQVEQRKVLRELHQRLSDREGFPAAAHVEQPCDGDDSCHHSTNS